MANTVTVPPRHTAGTLFGQCLDEKLARALAVRRLGGNAILVPVVSSCVGTRSGRVYRVLSWGLEVDGKLVGEVVQKWRWRNRRTERYVYSRFWPCTGAILEKYDPAVHGKAVQT
jgi:hypothetical protein